MYSVNSPRVGPKKQARRKKKKSGRSLNQMLQRTLRGVIDESVFLSWKETVVRAMKAGRTTAIVAFLELRIHYKWKDEIDSEIKTWKFKENMDAALKWISNEGLSYTLVFDRERGNDEGLPTRGALALQWFPSQITGHAEGTLMDFWRNKMSADIVIKNQKKEDWFCILKRGLITTGQTSVTLLSLEQSKDFHLTDSDGGRDDKGKYCSESRCRDFLTKDILQYDLFKGKKCYLDPSLKTLLEFIDAEGLDWFIGFDVIYELAYIPGVTNINKTLELYLANKKGDDDVDLEELGKFEDNQKTIQDSESVGVKRLSSWAYFMVTKRGW